RRGDIGVISASLKAHGQYKPIVVNKGTYTGRPNEVLAGNHTLMAIRDLAEQHPDDDRWGSVLVHWIDVDDDRAARIVLVDNRASEIGTVDFEQLYSLIGDLPDLEGTGYDQEYLTMLSEVTGGPPDLDALAEEVGDPLADDHHTKVSLSLEPEVARSWAAHRASFDDDTAAMRSLMNL
ncbi:MAG TPA: hypothetical protein PLA11_16990, partial [Flavobacteriales bacterium]|nr:hypothetical protein [Flavobacteriales bacterium]